MGSNGGKRDVDEIWGERPRVCRQRGSESLPHAGLAPPSRRVPNGAWRSTTRGWDRSSRQPWCRGWTRCPLRSLPALGSCDQSPGLSGPHRNHFLSICPGLDVAQDHGVWDPWTPP